jgi:F-type H+-transporting ATPase subunit c
MLKLLTLAPIMLSEITIDDRGLALLGGMLAVGIIVLGSARGIGQLAGSAVEAIARQPEAGQRIFTTMIVAAALIEGVTLFAMIICFMGMR